MSTCCVYVIRCKVNGCCYVGSTINYSSRKSQHKCSLRQNKHFSKAMQADYSQYGEDSFEFAILERVTDVTYLPQAESYHISILKPTYNIAKWAGRAQLDPSHYQVAPYEQTTQHIERTRKKLTGRKQTPEHKRKRQEAIDAARARGFVKRK